MSEMRHLTLKYGLCLFKIPKYKQQADYNLKMSEPLVLTNFQ